MAAIKDLRNPWRDRTMPAKFRGVEFHVELGSRQSGRRTVVHEFPKRDLPFSEDMGRHAIRYAFTGYLIHGDKRLAARGTNVIRQRDALIVALEQFDAGILEHPTMDPMLVMVERYSETESKQKGGYFEFDMQFVEAGLPVLSITDVATAQAVVNAAIDSQIAASALMNQVLRSLSGSGGVAPLLSPPTPEVSIGDVEIQ